MNNAMTPAARSSRRRRIASAAARIVLGLVLVANAPVGTLLRSPPSGPAGDALLDALWHSPWIMVLAKVVELSVGLLLLSNRFVALALTIFAPVLVNIVAFQASFSPQVLPLGIVLVALTMSVAWDHRASFAPLLRARPALTAAALALACFGSTACRSPESQAGVSRSSAALTPRPEVPEATHAYEKVGEVDVFFREAGPKDAPTLLLLHGFPSSSHQYRRLMDLLGHDVHVVAPDYPGFGFSDAPQSATAGGAFDYTFDHLADVIEGFCKQRGLTRFVVYMFDFGAPVGFRLALRHPEWIQGIVTQNGNAYVEGIAPGIAQMIRADAKAAPQTANAMRRTILTREATKGQYLGGASRPERVAPESWTLDQHFLDQPGRDAVMLSLLDDYKSNVASYPAWQRFLRERRPPTLIVWGNADPIFVAAGAHAWLRDVPAAEIHLIDGGHFVLEEEVASVAPLVRRFVLANGSRGPAR